MLSTNNLCLVCTYYRVGLFLVFPLSFDQLLLFVDNVVVGMRTCKGRRPFFFFSSFLLVYVRAQNVQSCPALPCLALQPSVVCALPPSYSPKPVACPAVTLCTDNHVCLVLFLLLPPAIGQGNTFPTSFLSLGVQRAQPLRGGGLCAETEDTRWQAIRTCTIYVIWDEYAWSVSCRLHAKYWVVNICCK